MNAPTPLDAAPARRLNRIHALLESRTFARDSPDDGPWKLPFAELIGLVDDLLSQSERSGKRINFYEGVGVGGTIQDVTSLVGELRAALPSPPEVFQGNVPGVRLNRYFDRGWGHFSNGVFFTVEFDHELAFFVDHRRIYLNRHLRRAVTEAEAHLNRATVPAFRTVR